MKQYLLAHDLGTSGNKATLFCTDGTLEKSRIVTYSTHYFNDTWVEQNGDDWWHAVCCSTRELIAETGIAPQQIKAVSFSGQMMGCLCVDRHGRPLRPSIIWADQRAVSQSKAVENQISQKDYYQIVGHRNTASYGIQKFMWVRDHEPEIYNQTYKILNAKDYIVFQLTGTFCTDYSDANSCGFFDLKTFSWSEELLSYTGIPMDKLPDPKPSTFCAGGVTAEAALQTGLSAGTPVIIGSGDGVATNVGAGSISPGKTFCCLGTSAWITTTSDIPLYDQQMRTVTWAHMVPGMYAPNGTMQYAGGSYSWLKSVICQKESEEAQLAQTSAYDFINREISQSPIGSNRLIFLPYLLGERAPRWDASAKGAWIGIKPETTRNDICRSVLEGITMNLSLILDVLRLQTPVSQIMVLGGGAKGAVWRQMMADIFNTEITVPALLDEAGAMGAAVNAGVGAGIFKDFSAIDRFLDIRSVHLPDKQAAADYLPVKELFNDCYDALRDVFQKM